MAERVSERFRALRDTVALALDGFDRCNALAPDRHALACDCAACELVEASLELVRLVDELDRGEVKPCG